jgi:carbamoylphosphate synthase small subunit
MVTEDKSSCKEFISERKITSQNHGFAVNKEELEANELEDTFCT